MPAATGWGRVSTVRAVQRPGPVYWTVCTVAAFDPGREFAFTVAGGGREDREHLAVTSVPAADGTDVTEPFELPDTLLARLCWLVRTEHPAMRRARVFS